MSPKTRISKLILTGQHCNPRYEVLIYGRSVWLPPSHFVVLLALMKARAAGRPRVRAVPMTVCRMRCEIAKVFDMAFAKDLIVDARQKRYFLNLAADELAFRPAFRTVRPSADYPQLKRLKTSLLRLLAEVPDASTQTYDDILFDRGQRHPLDSYDREQ